MHIAHMQQMLVSLVTTFANSSTWYYSTILHYTTYFFHYGDSLSFKLLNLKKKPNLMIWSHLYP